MKHARANNTFFGTIDDKPERRVEVEVGDSKQPDFHPQVKLLSWDNEVNLSVRLVHSEQAAVETAGEKIHWKGRNISAGFYETEAGYEFEVVLHEKPPSNIIEFTLQSKGLTFHYQPPLANLDVDGSTWEEPVPGMMCRRSAKVNGSYAVFHATKANHIRGRKNYFNGKAFHIYRPEATDANGVKTWCDLSIDAGLMKITIPQGYLDRAQYPVVIDPDFGKTAIGGSTGTYNAQSILAWGPYSPASNGNATSVSLYTWSANMQTETFGIYADSSTYPAAKLKDTAEGSQSAVGWHTLDLDSAQAILAAASYWFARNGSTQYNYAYDTGVTGKHYWYISDTYSAGTLTTPYPASATDLDGWAVSVYATYEEASGPSIPVLLSAYRQQ